MIVFVINCLFSVYYLLILIRILLPFIPHNRDYFLIRPIFAATEPLLLPIRLGLPPTVFGYDVSPFMVILLLVIVQKMIIYLIGGI